MTIDLTELRQAAAKRDQALEEARWKARLAVWHAEYEARKEEKE